MDFLLTVIAFVVIFSILILVHEWGHFFTAKKTGIKVEEFGFGYPPRIWGFKKGETLYSINWIPFGGFVRLLGEDSTDSKTAKDKRSFGSKSARVRILVITAGVIMNFLLAFVLLTTGYIVGTQPLILTGDEVLENFENGVIQTQDGIVVKEVDKGGAAENAGLKAGDRIIYVNGRDIVSDEQMKKIIGAASAGKGTIMDIERNGASVRLSAVGGAKGLGFSTYDLMYLPRVTVESVKAGSAAEQAGIMAGDVILKVNGHPVYYMEDFDAVISSGGELKIALMRDYREQEITFGLGRKSLAIITGVYPDTPAEAAGFEKGDVIVSINGTVLTGAKDIVAFTGVHKNDNLNYVLNRKGQVVRLTVKPGDDGLVGVGLSTISAYENSDLSVYASDVPVSVINIKNVSYPVWVAPVKAFEDCGRLAYLTVGMFGDVLKSLVTKFTVPEGVAGPVGIAVMTHTFVQQGVLSLLRFMALLSLSLAIINIFPLPALDGGKLIFILVEVIIGRKVSPRFEAIVHTLGFLLLLLFILFVTYSDIVKIFT
jgi:regulator of sigma E protease